MIDGSQERIERIRTAAVYVSDQEQAVRFWTEKVGFELRDEKPMGPHARWIEIAPHGAESCLVIYPRALMKDWAERKSSIVFACRSVAATYELLRSRGVEFAQEPTAMPWGNFAAFVDPDGNWFGLSDAP